MSNAPPFLVASFLLMMVWLGRRKALAETRTVAAALARGSASLPELAYVAGWWIASAMVVASFLWLLALGPMGQR